MIRSRLAAGRTDHIAEGGHLVIKEPHGSEGADLLFTAMPTSRLLFLIRDPRDCLDSILDSVESGWQGEDGTGPLGERDRRALLERSGRLWRHRIRCVRDVHDRLAPEARHVVGYEELRARPASTLRNIVEFIGLEARQEWLDHAVNTMAFERIPESKKGPGQFARQARPGGWRERFTPSEREWAAEFFAEELEHFSYDK